MKITRLRTVRGDDHRAGASCLRDVPCQLGAVDGICTGHDSPCVGPGVVDADCSRGGDQPCVGAMGSDMCNPTTGRDASPCTVWFSVDKEGGKRRFRQK